MKITQAEWNNYTSKMSALSTKASEEFVEWANANGGWRNIDRQLLAEAGWTIASKYAEGSSALAASMYEAIAQAEHVNVPSAELSADVDFGMVAKAINGALKDSDNDDFISAPVGRAVKQAGADTMLKNAARDHAEFAWVPVGDTCPFCLIIAANGWRRASKKTTNGGHAEHIHTHCNCQFAIRFNENTNVEGYNPETYQKIYYDAEGSNWKEKAKFIRANFKTGEMSVEEYIRAKELWSITKELDLPAAEKEYIYEQFDEWLTPEEKQSAIVTRPIKDSIYKAVHLGHNQYKIYSKEPIEPYDNIIEEILAELFGENWKDYEE